MENKSKQKIIYDDDHGIYVKQSEISVNWLLSKVLQAEDLQITKVSNVQLLLFLKLLDSSNLRMPNGQHSLFWLKDQLTEKKNMASSQPGEVWVNITDRYRYILEQIDLMLIGSKDIKEKMEIIKPEDKKIDPGLTPNNMECRFD
jgi:hypothetical protein